MRDVYLGFIRVAGALLTAFGLTVAVILLAHGNPRDALSALASGAWGTRYDVGNTLTRTTPLLLAGLGVAIAFRARLWNIGGEGQILMGALAACALGVGRLHTLPMAVLLPLVLTGGTVAGALWAGLAGWMRVARGVPEVISTIMLNFVAAALLSYTLHGPLQQRGRGQPARLRRSASPGGDSAHSPAGDAPALGVSAGAVWPDRRRPAPGPDAHGLWHPGGRRQPRRRPRRRY